MPEWPSNIITFNLNNIIYSRWAITLVLVCADRRGGRSGKEIEYVTEWYEQVMLSHSPFGCSRPKFLNAIQFHFKLDIMGTEDWKTRMYSYV